MTTSQSGAAGKDLWQRFVDAENRYYGARMALFQAKRALLGSDTDIASLVGQALRHPPEWGPALDILLDADELVRRQVFPFLVDVASSGHGYVQRVREVILSMERAWVVEHIGAEVDRVLQQDATYDEYRRLAELLSLVGSPHLARLVEQAAASENADIREVGDDFRSKL